METLYALVLTVAMTNGQYQDAVLGVYSSKKECEAIATEQHITGGACYPVDGILRTGDDPEKIAKF